MKTRLLLICNAYPSEAALYRNGFIHRRVKAYLEYGLQVDIFYNHEPISDAYMYEFDGVSVEVGNETALRARIISGKYNGYLIHFAEPSRVRPLQQLCVKEPVIVWVHGFEAEAWFRRWFTFMDSSKEIASALEKKESYYRTQNAFFHQLMTDHGLNLSFVNVSHWFQKYIVEPDNRAEFTNSTVIPNLVDEKIFPYREKSKDQRLKVLSIRPYASTKYANDQTVQAIVELSKRPFFDEFDFTICGVGPLFEQTVDPLKKFSNVSLENRFFDQEEIAELHAQHGVFLSPTRFDSQGVSMCEATSSGLVTISTDIAAVPEFLTDHETALLAPPEDVKRIADLMEELYFDPELFSRLSRAGSRAMNIRCGREATIGAEIELIEKRLKESQIV